MTDRSDLTAADRAILATIDTALDGGPRPTESDPALADFAALLRDSASQADADFRQRLRAEVVVAASAAQAERAAPWWRRRLTRRQAVAAGIAAVGLGGAAAVAAQIARLLDGVGGSGGGELVQGWALVQESSAPFPLGPGGLRGAGDRYTYGLFRVPRARWGTILGRLDPKPVPGAQQAIVFGGTLPIPGYLPAGFEWQGTSPIGDPPFGPGSIGGTSGGGGGGNLPWDGAPEFDTRNATYLIGGDATDRFIVLTQLRLDGHPEVRASGILFDIAASAMPLAGRPGASVGGTTPTPTPPPEALAAQIAAMVLAQPASGGAAATIRHGAATTLEATVGGRTARSFVGIWDASGTWNGTEEWRNLVWEQEGYLYHLAAQGLPLEELVRVAESLPNVP